MLDPKEAIINPVWKKSAPKLGPVAVMVSNQNDLGRLRQKTNLDGVRGSLFLMSRLVVGKKAQAGVSLVGPLIGAPYAVMLLETLIAGGARQVIFFGWCGAVSGKLKIGDIVVPSAALIDEGTSVHYQQRCGNIVTPSEHLRRQIRSELSQKKIEFYDGIVWTTDAVYRETPEKVAHFQSRDILAVEMETSALFSVGEFREVEIGAVLVVSDELSNFSWKPGFRNTQFRKSLDDVAGAISSLSRHLLQVR